MSNTNIRFINTNSSITQKVGVGLSAIIGPTGPQGFQGTIGYQGFQGISGFSTNTGAQGPLGFQGSQGTQGFEGFQGTQGFQGPTGTVNFETGSFNFLAVVDLIATNFTGPNIRTTNIEAINSTNLNIGSIDTQTINVGTSNVTQTVNVGTVGLGATTINIGGPGDQVRIAGDLVYINSSVDVLTNPYIILNNGATTINNSGLIIAQTGSSSTGVGGNTGAYFLVNYTQNGWVAKAGNGDLVNLNQDIGTGASPYFTTLSSTNLVTTTFTGSSATFNNVITNGLTGTKASLTNVTTVNLTGSIASLDYLNTIVITGTSATLSYLKTVSLTGTMASLDYINTIGLTGTMANFNNINTIGITGTNANISYVKTVGITGTNATFDTLKLNSSNIALGLDSASSGNTVAIGNTAFQTSSGDYAVAIGYGAGTSGNTQGYSVAVGANAGNSGQGQNTVAVGNECGKTNQSNFSVAIGSQAGFTTQAQRSIAIGVQAGYSSQGTRSIALGESAGRTSQGDRSVAIGDGAGYSSQGTRSVAIGPGAGNLNQAANSIIINASNSDFNGTGTGFFVNPIRNAQNSSLLEFNTVTNEITYSTSASLQNLTVNTMTGGSTYLDNLAIVHGVTGSTGSFQSLTVQNLQMNSGATISAPYDTLFVDGNMNVGNIYTVNIANSNVQYCNFTGGNFVNTVTINGIGGYIYATGGTGIGYFKTAVANQFLGNPADTTSLPSHSWSGDQTCGLYHPLTSTIGFVTTGAERMRITSGGNVGIGTTGPTCKLHVLSTGVSEPIAKLEGSGDTSIQLSATGGSNEVYIEFHNQGNSNTDNYSWGIGTNDDQNLHFKWGPLGSMNGIMDALTLYSTTGNVGVGIRFNAGYEAVAKLDVLNRSTVYTSNELAQNAFMIGTGKVTGDQVMYMGVNTGATPYSYIQSVNYGVAVKPLYLNCRGGETIMNLDGGNVGIGRTSPSSKLTVYDTTTCRISVTSFTGGETYSGILFFNTGNAGGAIFLNSSSRSGDGGANTLTLRNDIGVLRLQDTTSNGITIYNGNVGVSYSTPSKALDVAGLHRFGADGTAQFGGTGGSVFNILANNVPTLTSAGDFYIGQDKLLTSTNTVVGKQALNTIASHPAQVRNTAVGFLAGGYNTTGGYNVFLGSYAGGLNSIGTTNVYIGDSCAYGGTGGNNNVAVGYVALRSNGVASDNTSIGWFTMYNYTGTLGKNTVMGSEAGTTMVTNGNCTVLGYNAEPSSATVSNEITLGDASITVLRCNATSITSLSDIRDKTNITNFPSVEGFVSKLKPVQFEWNSRDGKKVGLKDYGFIAQEVDEAQVNEDKEWLNLVYKENLDRLELSQGKLIPVLVKALQECYSKIDELRGEVEELKKRVV